MARGPPFRTEYFLIRVVFLFVTALETEPDRSRGGLSRAPPALPAPRVAQCQSRTIGALIGAPSGRTGRGGQRGGAEGQQAAASGSPKRSEIAPNEMLAAGPTLARRCPDAVPTPARPLLVAWQASKINYDGRGTVDLPSRHSRRRPIASARSARGVQTARSDWLSFFVLFLSGRPPGCATATLRHAAPACNEHASLAYSACSCIYRGGPAGRAGE